MTYAGNVTIRTGLSACNPVVNITQTVEDLYVLYRNNSLSLVSNVFHNISVVNFNCTTSFGKYFEQVITFIQPIPIRIQIALVSIYFDYIHQNKYLVNGLNGLVIEQEKPIYLSSISCNNNIVSDACSSGDIAQDPLCLQNSSKAQCINLLSNPWIFNCSEYLTTSLSPLLSTTYSNDLLSNKPYSTLSPWQIGLTCALTILFLLTSLIVIGYLYRRRSHSKTFVLKVENFFDETNSMKKSGVPQGQAFQRTATSMQPEQRNHATIAWIHKDIDTTVSTRVGNGVNLKSSEPYKRSTYIDHAKIYESTFPSNIRNNTFLPTHISNDRVNLVSSRVNSGTNLSPSISFSESSTIQLKKMINQVENDKVHSSDTISSSLLNSNNSKRCSTPVSGIFTHTLSINESLHDEDAWMPILDVANAELDRLNRLENLQNQMKTVF